MDLQSEIETLTGVSKRLTAITCEDGRDHSEHPVTNLNNAISGIEDAILELQAIGEGVL